MENQTDFKVTKLIVQFSVDCFPLTSGRGGFASVQIHKKQKPEWWSAAAKFGPVSLAVPLGVSFSLFVSQITKKLCTHILGILSIVWTADGIDGCHAGAIWECAKMAGFKSPQTKRGQFKTFAFCTSIWLCWLLLEKSHFFCFFFIYSFVLLERRCTVTGLTANKKRLFFSVHKSQIIIISNNCHLKIICMWWRSRGQEPPCRRSYMALQGKTIIELTIRQRHYFNTTIFVLNFQTIV